MQNSETPADYQTVINLDSLALWMTEQGLGDGPIQGAHLLTGGSQNFLLRFQRDDRGYVLRRPPKHLRKNSNATMLREAQVLDALSESPVPHPKFIAACDDESVLGCCFYLMDPVEGFNAVNGLPAFHRNDPGVRHRMGLALVEGIAALGSVDYKAVGLQEFGKPHGFLERQVPRWQAQLDSYAQLDNWPGTSQLPGIGEITRWLERNRPKTFTPGIMHGDYHVANVMYHNDSAELAAIIDWELSTIGDPLIDLGWLIATWHDPEEGSKPRIEPWDGFPTIEELISHYAKHSDRDLDGIAWYGVLACFKLGVLLEGTYARACAGRASKDAGDHLHANAINLFHRALRMLGQNNW